MEYINRPWDWHSIAQNPNLTLSFIEKRKSKFSDYDLSELLRNYFYIDDIGFKNSLKKDIEKRRKSVLNNFKTDVMRVVIFYLKF